MKILDFNERLKDSILIADGAMGSLLHETVGTQRCFDELNTTEPEAVFRVHQAYIEAGAQIIETNTFGANRFKLSALGLGDEVQRLNSRGVKIAREARESAAREVLIAGSIGPLGLGVQARHPEPEQILEIFREQAQALEERGVDLFILETFTYIEEILLAIDAIRSFSGMPIVASLTYAEDGRAYGDLSPADAPRPYPLLSSSSCLPIVILITPPWASKGEQTVPANLSSEEVRKPLDQESDRPL